LIGHEIPAVTGDDAVRFVRALGSHRYVRSRLHLVHAFAFEAACQHHVPEELADAHVWAKSILGTSDISIGSKDERLWRPSTEREIAAMLGAFWTGHEHLAQVRASLATWLDRAGAEQANSVPFDESAEQDMFPVLVDAGWELLPLTELDPVRHQGAIRAFGEPIAFESAKFEEESAIPKTPALQELSALGPTELMAAVDDSGVLRGSLVLWTGGNEVYQDYVLRGVLKAAKLEGAV
jgi:hypothetical protein